MKLLDIFKKGNNKVTPVSPFASRAARRAYQKFTGEKVVGKNMPFTRNKKEKE